MEQEPGPVMVMAPGVTPWMPTSVGESFVPMVFSPTKWMVVSPGTRR